MRLAHSAHAVYDVELSRSVRRGHACDDVGVSVDFKSHLASDDFLAACGDGVFNHAFCTSIAVLPVYR